MKKTVCDMQNELHRLVWLTDLYLQLEYDQHFYQGWF